MFKKCVSFKNETREAKEFTFRVRNKAVCILQSAELDRLTTKVLSVYLYKGRKLNKTDKLRLGTQITRDEMCNTARR